MPLGGGAGEDDDVLGQGQVVPAGPPLRITAAYTERLEAACDEYNETLPKLNSRSESRLR